MAIVRITQWAVYLLWRMVHSTMYHYTKSRHNWLAKKRRGDFEWVTKPRPQIQFIFTGTDVIRV
jgi:hypothetical protein